MRIVGASLLFAMGCWSSPPPSTPIAHRVDPARLVGLEPVIETPAGSDECPLRWDELADLAPTTIELTPLAGSDPRLAVDANAACPWFDPTAMSCSGYSECNVATMRGARNAALTVGRASGGFVSLGIAVEGKGFACVTASTVGAKNLYPLGTKLIREPWLADVDGDQEAELVIWTRLPWGDQVVATALMPVVYVLDGSRLVRRDDVSHDLRKRVSATYRRFETMAASGDKRRACYASVATALGS
ncbi:MAG TPA: hypothetical protein VL326_34665 [Kofleriaceae bacterium]|nr:hypothetical protein [Kofleriaceae bacterium]